jgi:5-(carboxyamino)imidazole ribonucleotide synthase
MPRAPLPPGSTIGILGGGQLARMLSVAASGLGLKCHVYSDQPFAPAFDVAAGTTVALYQDEDAVGRFAASVDVVTCEFENVPAQTLEAASRQAPVCPAPKSFAIAQDRLKEKEFLRELGIPVASFARVESEEELGAALALTKFPALLKTRRLGYDGKGQAVIGGESEAHAAWDSLGRVPAIAEAVIAFEREISALAVRGQDGETRFYDPVENHHQGGILATSRAPARISEACTVEARRIAGTIAEALSHVGVLCVEMFQGEGPQQLIVNEIAPRVHNSGHWTLDACLVSQFENHIRAIAGWPLGSTARHSDAVMTNLIGGEVNRWPELAAEDDVALHLYGKAEALDGRKMGHVTRLFPRS